MDDDRAMHADARERRVEKNAKTGRRGALVVVAERDARGESLGLGEVERKTEGHLERGERDAALDDDARQVGREACAVR